MQRRAALVVSAGLLLAACDHTQPYRRPELPVPDQFELVASAAGLPAAETGWRSYFLDPQLQQDIAAALEHNRDLAASVARIEQARALYRIQDAARRPQLNATGGAMRTQVPLSSLDPELPANNRSAIYDQFNVQVVLVSYEIDFWGRVHQLSEAALHRYLATLEGERAFRLVLIGNVAATYYAVSAGEAGIELAERTLASRQQSLEIARLRLDAGVTSSIDFDQAVVLVAQAKTQLAELQRVTALRQQELFVLIGGKGEGPRPARGGAGSSVRPGELAAGLPSALLENRPDIQQAEQQLLAANADIAAARAAFFPRFALTGNLGYASTDLGDLLKPGKQSWALGGAVSLPIFDGGQLSAQLGQTQARRDELVAGYQQTVLKAFGEVSDALVGRQRYQEQIAAQEAAVDAQRRLAEIAELRYENGVSIYLEVLDAERSLFTAQQQLIQLRASALQNGVSLYVALGGGTASR